MKVKTDIRAPLGRPGALHSPQRDTRAWGDGQEVCTPKATSIPLYSGWSDHPCPKTVSSCPEASLRQQLVIFHSYPSLVLSFS